MTYMPSFGPSNAAIAYALDLANGDIEDERKIIDVECDEIISTHDNTNNNQSRPSHHRTVDDLPF